MFVVLVCCILMMIFFEMVHVENDNNQKQRSPLRDFEQILQSQKLHVPSVGIDLGVERGMLEQNKSHIQVIPKVVVFSANSNETAINVPKIDNEVKIVNVIAEVPSIVSESEPIQPQIEVPTTLHVQQLVPSYEETHFSDLFLQKETVLEVVTDVPTESYKRVIINRSQNGLQRMINMFPKLSELHQSTSNPELYNSDYEQFFPVMSRDFSSSRVLSEGDDYSFGVLERFHHALNSGSACPDVTEFVDSAHAALVQSVADLVRIVVPKVLLEFAAADEEGGMLSDRSVSRHVAAMEPALTAVFVVGGRPRDSEIDSTPTKLSGRCAEVPRSPNLFVSTSTDSVNRLLDSHSAQTADTSSTLQCIQLVHSLGDLVRNMLPFEFENDLGALLCRCSHTYLPKSLPADQPFFAFWDHSTSALVTAAVKAVSRETKNVCRISLDMGDSSTKHLYSSIRYTHLVAQRFDPRLNSSSPVTPRESVAGSEANVTAKETGHLPVSLLSAMSLDPQSTLSLSLTVVDHVARSGRAQRHGNLSTTTVIDRLANSSDGSVLMLFDADFSPKRLSRWVDGLSSRGGEVFDPLFSSLEEEEEEEEEENRKQMRLKEQRVELVNVGANMGGSPISAVIADEVTPKMSHDAVMGSAVRAGTQTTLVVTAPSNVSTSSHTYSAEQLIGRAVDSFEAASVRDNSSSSPLLQSTTRRRLYSIYNPASKATSTSGTTGSSTSSSRLVDKQAPYSLTWELSERLSEEVVEASAADETDGEIRHQIANMAYKRGASSDSGKSSIGGGSYSLSNAARATHRLLQEREDFSYRSWMYYLKLAETVESTKQTSGVGRVQTARLVYVMGRKATLLSIKLSRLMISAARTSPADSSGLVVSLLFDSAAVTPHEQLLRMLGLKNNVICAPDWRDVVSFSALLGTPERAQVAVIQADVIIRALFAVLSAAAPSGTTQCENTALLVEEALAALLSLADLSYVELPSPVLLHHLLLRSHPQNECIPYLAARYAERGTLLVLSAVQLPRGTALRIEELPLPTWESSSSGKDGAKGLQVFRVTMERDNLGTFDFSMAFTNKGAFFGLSVYTALHFGLVNSQRRVLLNMLVNLPLWSLADSIGAQIVPWRLFVRLSGICWALWYHDISTQSMREEGGVASVSRHAASVTARLSKTERSARGSSMGISASESDGTASSDRNQGISVWRALQSELRSHTGELTGGKFSFVEHNSGYGYVSMRLARVFPNATVISLERSAAKVKHHVAMAEQLRVTNNAVCQKAADDSVIHKNLYESPELFRFQLRAHSLMEDFIASPSVAAWGESIGTLLSVALTTFIYAPDAAQVSWAMHLLFGEVYERRAECDDLGACYRRHIIGGTRRPLSEVLGSDRKGSEDGLGMSSVLSTLHPQAPYRDFESRWLLEAARVAGGQTTVMVSPLAANEQPHVKVAGETSASMRSLHQLRLPIVRCDLVNMTRHVHHHYEYAKDGHSRTYTMRVRVNETLSDEVLSRLGDPSRSHSVQLESAVRLSIASSLLNHRQEPSVADRPDGVVQTEESGDVSAMVLPAGNHPNQHKTVSVQLFRDRDAFPIPYTSIYGVTLITALRLGLESAQRERLFGQFLRLPLYEDMAPWNVVLMGAALDYIDYDTRQFTYSADVPRAYRVMSVLMNYKRTVEDFKRCGSKASTVYGLPYVSDCVGSVDK
jgi:hypothetical protein